MNEQLLFHRACALGVLCMLALVAFGQAAGQDRPRKPPLEDDTAHIIDPDALSDSWTVAHRSDPGRHIP